jgi:elongation factor P
MYTPTDFKNGLTLEWKGNLYQVVEFLHVKPGKGAAFVRTKFRNLTTKKILEESFRMNEQFKPAHVERKEMQYLYQSGDNYTFMDMKSYEQVELSKNDLGDNVTDFLKEEMVCSIMSCDGKVLSAELPNSIELIVQDTAPNEKGNTSSGGSKPAILETGASIDIPFFVNIGDKIRLNPQTREYQDRVKA